MSWWIDRPVFVTGATGLVGGHVVRQLRDRGADVVCLVRDRAPASQLWEGSLPKSVNIVWGDLSDQAVLERALGEYEVDTVIHLAAQTIVGIATRNPISTFESNIGGTWRLLEAARRSPRVRQIVIASSDKAYGEQAKLPYDESAPLDATFPYDTSKAAAELIARTYAASWGMRVAITRCGNFYGGGDLNWNRIVPGTIRSLLRGERPVIRSDGDYVRDYFYVEDGADAYLLLAEALADGRAAAGEAFNFSYERPLSVREIVTCVAASLGSKLEPEIRNEATNEIRRQYLSAAKARAQLGWAPRVGFDEGMARTVAWYRAHLGA